MDTIVIANPIQLTMVKAVPFDAAGALVATKEENKGESAITANPHMIRKLRKTTNELISKTNGDTKQQTKEACRKELASFFVLYLLDSSPPSMHERPPTPMRHECPKRIQLPHMSEVTKGRSPK